MTDTSGLIEDAAKIDITTQQNGDTETAAARLAQEARQVTGFSSRSMRDITKDFEDASNGLANGKLIKDEYFTLFEAVGALEIMDPKMDTGVVPSDETDDLELDPAAELSAAETIWVMDELLCLEAAWLEDYPLSQTVFTSIHIDRILDPENRYPYSFELRPGPLTPPNLTNLVLHAYCLATIKCNSMVLELARSQGFYEEEDFISHTFGRDLLPDLTADEALARLEDVLVALEAYIDDDALREAIRVRLTFRKLFMRSIFGGINGWHDMVGLLEDEIEMTRDLAEPKPECFTEKVLRHLATSTPPRPKLNILWTDAKKRWTKFCNDVAEAPQLTAPWIRQSPASLQRAMWSFAARESSTFPRSVMQDIMFVDDRIADDLSHFDLILIDVRELVLPGSSLVDLENFQIEVVTDPRHECARLMEGFVDDILDEYLNLYRMLCQNRARIRRDLTKMISILDTLETRQATKLDDEIATVVSTERLDTVLGKDQAFRPLSTWTRYYKLRAMAETIHLGFETDIYMPDEMAHMYWYLGVLLSERLKLIQHIEAFTQHRAASLNEEHELRRRAECVVALEWYEALKLETNVYLLLSSALNDFYAILMHLKLVTAPKRSFANPQMLHETRMRIYLSVKDPLPPTVEQFAEAGSLSASIPATLDQIDAAVKQARADLATMKTIPADVGKYIGTEDRWKSEIKQLETTAVAIFVAATQIRRKEAKSSTNADWSTGLDVTIPPPGKRYHEWWAVPQVKAKR